MNRMFFFKQKTAYELRISDWSSDVCSSDLPPAPQAPARRRILPRRTAESAKRSIATPKFTALSARSARQYRSSFQRAKDRKSVVQGKSVSVRVDLGCRRIINKKTTKIHHNHYVRYRTATTHITQTTH